MIRAFVGAGGKTTLIHTQAEQFRAEGKRVFVTTSTHMAIESDTVLSDDPAVILRELDRPGQVMAGLPHGEKIGPLSPETYTSVCRQADVVLVEADGSNRKPIKFPNATEPAIYGNVEEIVVVCGLHALGKPIGDVAHRLELVLNCLGVPANTPVTVAHIAKLSQEGYLHPLKEKYPGVKLSVYPAGGTKQEKQELLSLLFQEETP